MTNHELRGDSKMENINTETMKQFEQLLKFESKINNQRKEYEKNKEAEMKKRHEAAKAKQAEIEKSNDAKRKDYEAKLLEWQQTVNQIDYHSNWWLSQGLCGLDGGKIVGLFNKRCSICKYPPGTLPSKPPSPNQPAYVNTYVEVDELPLFPEPSISDMADKILPELGGIKWKVLDVQDGKALLLTEDILEIRAYHSTEMPITWEKCDLRRYLNNDFFNGFADHEKKLIVETKLQNKKNIWYDTLGGSDTNDKVFMLSMEEADKYFGNSQDYLSKRRKNFNPSTNAFHSDSKGPLLSNKHDKKRKAARDLETAAAIEMFDAPGHSWWLRTPGWASDSAACVMNPGLINVSGISVNNFYAERGVSLDCGVRPAMWVDIQI